MESEFKETTETIASEVESLGNALNTEVGNMMSSAKLPVGNNDQPWQEWIDVVVDFLSKVPEQLGSFFSNYKQPLTTLALILTAAISVYITLSILDAVKHIPLLASILELIGLGYTIWFVTRYLLKASNRQELFAELDSFKQQILGK